MYYLPKPLFVYVFMVGTNIDSRTILVIMYYCG